MAQPRVDRNKMTVFYLEQIAKQKEFQGLTIGQSLLIAELVIEYYEEAIIVGYKAGYDEAMQKVAQSKG